MDLEIRKHMESLCGECVVGVQVFVAGERYMCLLFDEAVLLAAMTLQKIGRRVYIRNVDTTGCVRGHTRRFVISVLRVLSPDLVCCFSVPRSEYIFHRSSENEGKRVRGAGELLKYWVGIFSELCSDVHVWSNHYEPASHPFTSMSEVVYFEDDPKKKLGMHFKGGLEKMFAALLCRADFASGSLVYGRLQTDARGPGPEARPGDVDGMEAMLRSLDFSTEASAKESTGMFMGRFGLSVEYFRGHRSLGPGRAEVAHAVLKPRRKT